MLTYGDKHEMTRSLYVGMAILVAMLGFASHALALMEYTVPGTPTYTEIKKAIYDEGKKATTQPTTQPSTQPVIKKLTTQPAN